MVCHRPMASRPNPAGISKSIPRLAGDPASSFIFRAISKKAKLASPPPQPPPSEEEFPRGRPGEIVLIVEDDENARRATAQGVRELGYTVLEAESGKEAIRLLRARADIALMITDVVMPEMDGARLAREAVFRRHALHVMFITGYSQHAIARDGMLDPDVNLLTKPFSLAQLAKKIREVLDARGDLPKGKP